MPRADADPRHRLPVHGESEAPLDRSERRERRRLARVLHGTRVVPHLSASRRNELGKQFRARLRVRRRDLVIRGRGRREHEQGSEQQRAQIDHERRLTPLSSPHIEVRPATWQPGYLASPTWRIES